MFGYEWLSRWLVLQPATMLYYFDNSTDKEPAGAYMLSARSQVQVHTSKHGRSNVIELNVDPGDAYASSVFLSAPSSVEAEAWARAIASFRSQDALQFDKAYAEEHLASARAEASELRESVQRMELSQRKTAQTVQAMQEDAAPSLAEATRQAVATAGEAAATVQVLATACLKAYQMAHRTKSDMSLAEALLPPPVLPQMQTAGSAQSAAGDTDGEVAAAVGPPPAPDASLQRSRANSWTDDMASATVLRGGRVASDTGDRADFISHADSKLLEASLSASSRNRASTEQTAEHTGIDQVAARAPSGMAMDLAAPSTSPAGQRALLMAARASKAAGFSTRSGMLAMGSPPTPDVPTPAAAAAGAGDTSAAAPRARTPSAASRTSSAVDSEAWAGANGGLVGFKTSLGVSLAQLLASQSRTAASMLSMQRLVAYISAHALPWWTHRAGTLDAAQGAIVQKLQKYKEALTKLAGKTRHARLKAQRRKMEATNLRASLVAMQETLGATRHALQSARDSAAAAHPEATKELVQRLCDQHAYFLRALQQLKAGAAAVLAPDGPLDSVTGLDEGHMRQRSRSHDFDAAPLPPLPHAHLLGTDSSLTLGSAPRRRTRSRSGSGSSGHRMTASQLFGWGGSSAVEAPPNTPAGTQHAVTTSLLAVSRLADAQAHAEAGPLNGVQGGEGTHLRRVPVSQFGLTQTNSSTALQMRDSLLGMQAALSRVEGGMQSAFAQCISELVENPVVGPAVRETIQTVQVQLQQAEDQRAALAPKTVSAPANDRKGRSTAAAATAVVAPSKPLPPPPAIKAFSGRGQLLVLVCEARNMPLPPSWAAVPGAGNRRPSWLRLGSDGGEGGVPSWAVGASSLPPALLRLDKAASHPTLQVSLGAEGTGVVAGVSSKGLTGYFAPGRGSTTPELKQFQEGSLAEDAPRGWCSLWNEVSRLQLSPAASTSDSFNLNVCVHIAPPAAPEDATPTVSMGGSPYPESAHKPGGRGDDGSPRVGTVVGRASFDAASCRKWPWQPHACWLDVAAGAALTPPALAHGASAAAAPGSAPLCPMFDITKATATPPTVPMFRVSTSSGDRGVLLPTSSTAAVAGKGTPSSEPPMPVHNLTYALQQQQLAALRGNPSVPHELASQLPSAQRWAAPELPPLPAGGTPTLLLQAMWIPEEDSSFTDGLHEPHWFLPRERASAAVAAAHEGHPLRKAVAHALHDELSELQKKAAADAEIREAGSASHAEGGAGGSQTLSESGRLTRANSVSSHLSGLSDVSMDARAAGRGATGVTTPGNSVTPRELDSPPLDFSPPTATEGRSSPTGTEDSDSPVHARRRAVSDMPGGHTPAPGGSAGGGASADLKKKLHFMAEAYRKLQKKEATAAAKLRAAQALLKEHGITLD